jgi:FlaA1/EpsC-like NDP-sugar epimerase
VFHTGKPSVLINKKERKEGRAARVVQSIRIRLLTLPREAKQASMIAYDAVCYWASAVVSYWTVFGTLEFTTTVATISVIAILIAVPVHWFFGLYASIVRYTGLMLLVVGVRTTFVVTAILMTATSLINLSSAPFRVGIVFWAFSLILVVGGRVAARMFLSRRNAQREPIIIYGAGDAGAQLIAALIGGDDYLPVALVDDDPKLQNQRIYELKVYSPEHLEKLLATTAATRILLAIPSASRRKRRHVLEFLSGFPIRVQTMPEITDIVTGKARVDDIRDVGVEELLSREPVPPNPELLDASVVDKNVLVTGAGGSIGSELCRQILALNPVRLVLFELSEASLYRIERELENLAKKLERSPEIVSLLGSVHHESRVREIMRAFDIQTVYHAAAYKHVPMVERNLFEGIHNNVFGTLHTVRAAIDSGVETFVLISTDKAVNPTSVMGATKRLSEEILQCYHSRNTETRLCMVRFGNVLESSGSVVPLFREQIRSGGPVTVTHRDIVRYFMTIPEAAQLVIQAAAMAKGGDLFVLDMGQPVRIDALARSMVNLMGCTIRDDDNPDGDIEIQYIGLRPAEKLYEELLIGASVSGTEHPRILRADEAFLSFEELDGLLRDLLDASKAQDHDRARDILLQAVKEYSPTNGIDDLVWLKKTGTEADTSSDRVVDFPKKKP